MRSPVLGPIPASAAEAFPKARIVPAPAVRAAAAGCVPRALAIAFVLATVVVGACGGATAKAAGHPQAALATDGGSAPASSVTAAPPAAGRDQFVRVRGNQFVLGEKTFRFVGANMAIMHGPDNRAAAEAVLGGAARDGITVGRVWALGEGEADANAWLRDNFLFRAGPEGWIEAAPKHLDRVIAAAERTGIRLIITLANHWADYGGAPRYLRWAGRMRDGVYGVGDRFYGDARVKAAYRAHVQRLLSRTNHLTGRRYGDDPTIMAWELMNESSVATTTGAADRRAWMSEMAGLIHKEAPHHLVSAGVAGYRVERERLDWVAICRLPEIDFCDGHLYPEEASKNRDATYLDTLLDDYVRAGQVVAGKPFVLGEFGVRGDPTGQWQGKTRPFWVAHILERLRFDGAAGALIWIYQPARGPDRAFGISVDAPGADPAADELRKALAAAAGALIAPPPRAPSTGANPLTTAGDGGTALMPLHAEFSGTAISVPLIPAEGPPPRGGRSADVSVTWNPATFARADWEASGVYGGGAIEHVWGSESGWFEYDYQIVAARGGGTASTLEPAAVTVRARVSSEFPGSLSPPDGASDLEVFLDGVSIGRARAPRDDGRGRWVTVRASGGAVPHGALTPGRHRLRFAVAPGPRAHGLAIYGRPGEKPDGAAANAGPIELRLAFKPSSLRRD